MCCARIRGTCCSSWTTAADPVPLIGIGEVAAGVSEARRRVGRLVLAPMRKGLSDIDRRFLSAMAQNATANLTWRR